MEPKFNLSDLTLQEPDDTITLSSSYGYAYANTATTTVSGGGYTVPNVSISSGTGISSPYLTSTGAYPTWSNGISPKIKLDGEGADIEINGESLVGLLKQISERLNLLKPNEKMEKEWDQLRELGEQYRALEAKLKEQGDMWAKLKAMPPPQID
jgi:hypothetical protein